MNLVLIGSVGSSQVVLDAILEAGMRPKMVFSLDPEVASRVSGYVPIHEIAAKQGIPFQLFRTINSERHIDQIKALKPDYIFVVGLSQLIGRPLLDLPTRGVIGFHPTPLPQMRGRAALPWQIILGVRETKCTLFLIDEGMDSGDILDQESYTIEETDYVFDVSQKCRQALKRMMQRVLPALANDSIVPRRQDETKATYLLKRGPEDGLIDWNKSATDIHRLIRAVAPPYPGAFTFIDGMHKLVILRAKAKENSTYYGLPGQIAATTDGILMILCGSGMLEILEYENVDSVRLRAGHKCMNPFLRELL